PSDLPSSADSRCEMHGQSTVTTNFRAVVPKFAASPCVTPVPSFMACAGDVYDGDPPKAGAKSFELYVIRAVDKILDVRSADTIRSSRAVVIAPLQTGSD